MADANFDIQVKATTPGLDKALAQTKKLEQQLIKVDSRGRLRDSKGRFLSMGKGADKAAKATTRLGRAGQLAARGFDRVTAAGSRAVQKVAEWGKTAALVGAVAVGAFGKMTFEAASFGQASEQALEQLMGGGGRAAFDDIVALADRFNLPIKETTKQFQKLLAMQFAPEAAKGIIKMSADLQALGANAEETGRVVTAITQIKAKGRVQSEELLQLSEAGVSTELVLQALGKRLGKTTKEVQSMMQKGLVPAEVGIEAIGDAIKKKAKITEFGEAAQKASGRLANLGTKLQNKVTLAFLNLGRRALPILEGRLIPALDKMFAAFSGARGGLVLDVMSAGVEKMIDGLAFLARSMPSFFDSFVEGFSQVEDALGPVDAFFEGMGDNAPTVREVGRAVGQLTATLIAMLGVFSQLGLLNPFQSIKQGFEGLMTVANAPAEAIKAAALSIQNAFNGIVATLGAFSVQVIGAASSIGTGIITGMVAGITGGASAVINAAVSVAKSAVGATQAALGQSSPSKVFAQIGRFNAEGMAMGMEAGTSDVQRAAVGMATPDIGGMLQSRASGTTATMNMGAPTINISAADDPEATAAAVRRVLVGEMADAFEQVSIMVGGT